MKNPTLIAFMGPRSQTGTALQEEAARCNVSVQIPDNSDGWDTLVERIKDKQILLVLPVWNSHEGEITKSRVIELLMEGKAVLHKLWPKRIEFECITRLNRAQSISTVVSVPVAKTQCSNFLKRIDATFIDGISTTLAYKRFEAEAAIDAALCVPRTCRSPFVVRHPDVANDINFTTFAIIGNTATSEWNREWGKLAPLFRPTACSISAVELSQFSVTSDEDQTAFFNEFTSAARNSADLPRIVFAARRPPDRCGLIIESELGRLPRNIISEDGYSSEIKIRPNVGTSSERYGLRVREFLNQTFSRALKYDFVRHVGTKTCFFACPSLGMLTHGYDLTVVEPVVRRYVAKWFQLVDDGLECTEQERRFFKRYRREFYDDAERFFKFITV